VNDVVLRQISPLGELGLHRPYLASSPQGRQAVEKQIPLMLSLVKQYIVEMNITDNFLSADASRSRSSPTSSQAM
jgi:hypothetical protein